MNNNIFIIIFIIDSLNYLKNNILYILVHKNKNMIKSRLKYLSTIILLSTILIDKIVMPLIHT